MKTFLIAICIVKQKIKKCFWMEKKIAKQSRHFKDYAGSYNFTILNCFNPELKTKVIESGIKDYCLN